MTDLIQTSDATADATVGGAGSPGLLRLATAGSVDDGKSTLVGRLLHDAKAVLTDQLDAVARATRARSGASGAGTGTAGELDLSLLTDGLRAEREQGITIDVAYRYFATARRTFVLADTPGHVQYTRNTVTGMSTADVAVLLADARNGLVEQTRRHLAVTALLGVGHVVLAVNKMDLVGWDPGVFAAVESAFAAHARALGIPSVAAVPVSALHGDNVVDRSTAAGWYTGAPLLEHLETVPLPVAEAGAPLRYPVQLVLRDGDGGRWYAGQVAGGEVRVGDEVLVLPSGRRTRVTGVQVLGAEVPAAGTGRSAAVRLADELDVARGDLLASPDSPPQPATTVEATLCWLSERPLRVGDRLLLTAGPRAVRAAVTGLSGRLDTDTLDRETAATTLGLNDIGTVTLRTAEPVALDDYSRSRRTGSFLLVDPGDGSTLAAGLVGDPLTTPTRTTTGRT